jgi:ParB family transcriptional regulator, chromosome partitioning protein
MAEEIKNINISDIIESPYQGRMYEIIGDIPEKDEARIVELADSIELNGLLQPIVVRSVDNNKYEVIDGHRRVIAYNKLGFKKINAIIKKYSDKEAQVFSVIGNLQRKNLSPIENAIAFKKILAKKIFPSNAALSKALGKDPTYVGDVLNILKMDKRIIDDLLQNKTLNDTRLLRLIRNAYPLKYGKDTCEKQYEFYKYIITNKLSRRQAYNYLQEEQVKEIIEEKKLDVPKSVIKDTQKRNELKQKYKQKRIVKKESNRTVKVNIDLSGYDVTTKEKLLNKINDLVEELENSIKNLNK